MRQRVPFEVEEFLRSTQPNLLTEFLEMLQTDHSDSGPAATRLLQQLLKAVKREAPHGRHVPVMLELLQENRDLSRLVEGPLKCVNDLDSPRGRACIQRIVAELDGAVDPETDFISAGMRLMISHADMFRRLLAIYQVEQTVDWRMYRGRQPGDVDISQDDADALAADFAHVLRKHGDSGRCVPTVYRQSERVIVEIAHESYAEALREFRGNDIEVDWRRPVRHARLVYRPSTGLLKIKVHGNDEGLAHLLGSRAGHHMFGDKGHFCEDDAQAKFDLSSLKSKPDLQIANRYQVENVEIIGLQLKLVGVRGAFAKYTATDTDDLYTLVSENVTAEASIEVAWARLRFKFPGSRNKGQRTIELTPPLKSNLGEDDYDRIIEKHLSQWGILNAPEPCEADLKPDRDARNASIGMARPRTLFAKDS